MTGSIDIARVGRSLRPARPRARLAGIAFALGLVLTPAAVQAQQPADDFAATLRSAGGGDRDVRAFYAARNHRPLWVRVSSLGPEAYRLVDLIETADLDGLDPDDYRPRALAEAVDKARGGSPKALAKAEMLLSRRFAQYVSDVRKVRPAAMVYVDRELRPTPISPRAALEEAAAAPSFARHVQEIGWMNPIYGQLRRALAGVHMGGPPSPERWRQERLIRVNLDRARALPADPGRKHIVVDVASARLWMYENGRVRDTMKVVVGKSTEQTPIMAGLIRFAMVNPYWNIPPDLVRDKAASGVLAKGFRAKRFEALSDWTDGARVLKPAEIDWQAVAAGRQELRVRQLPGRDNAMGKMKFMLPNDLGIYLHDTPEKELFKKADRRFSSGCVRVEDAARLAKWLFGKPLTPKAGAREKQVDLPRPVPVYITYLTAAPQGQTVVFRPDVYNRDSGELARLGGRTVASR